MTAARTRPGSAVQTKGLGSGSSGSGAAGLDEASYNAQAAVDAEAQIIVAHELTQCGSDQGQLVQAIENNLGRKPEQASADSGYCSEPNLKALA